MTEVARDSARMFATPAVAIEHRADGTQIMRSPQPLEGYARCIGEHLERWARTAPTRPFLLERPASGGDWQGVTYRESHEHVLRIGTWLLKQNLSAQRPVAILSDNSVEHGLIALACMHVGIPVAPV